MPQILALAEGYEPPDAPDHRAFSAFDLRSRRNEEARLSSRSGDTAILPIHGALSRRMSLGRIFLGIGPPTIGEIESEVEALAADRDVRQIILNINSPGGEVDGIMEAAEAISRASQVKPVIAYVDGVAASAAYWLATAANKIVATKSSRVGSIGVYSVLMDSKEAQEKMGFRLVTVSSGGVKGLGADGEVSEKLVAEVERMVLGMNDLFVRDVAKYRSVALQQVQANWNDGRSHLAAQAEKLGMIDGTGTLRSLLSAAEGGSTMPDNAPDMMVGSADNDELKAQIADLSKIVGSLANTVKAQQDAAEARVAAEREGAAQAKESAIEAALNGLIRERKIAPSERDGLKAVLKTSDDAAAQDFLRSLSARASTFGGDIDLPNSDTVSAQNAQPRTPDKLPRAFVHPTGKTRVDPAYKGLHNLGVKAANDKAAPGTPEWFKVYSRTVDSAVGGASGVEIC